MSAYNLTRCGDWITATCRCGFAVTYRTEGARERNAIRGHVCATGQRLPHDTRSTK